MDEIDAFFAGATGWDLVITAIVLVLLFKFLKKYFFIGIIIAIGYYIYKNQLI